MSIRPDVLRVNPLRRSDLHFIMDMDMTVKEFINIWPVLKRQVMSLHVSWLDEMSSSDNDPFRVLISCLLSLRTKDKVTGEASERLFKLARTPKALSQLSAKKIERTIYPVGFYRVKAKRIRDLSRLILRKHNGKVPNTIEELLLLKGVGRKTANLVATLGYGQDGICVDTHVHRITNRLGLVRTNTPTRTEFALREIVPLRYWKELNSLLVAFGQGVCKPISPLCSRCRVRTSCNRVGVTLHR
jgi:endonuclease-3